MMTHTTDIPEAFLEADTETGPPISADALEAFPSPPPPPDSEKLEEESSHHRVLLVRTGAVIALTTLISIGGALFLHTLFALLFLLGTWFPILSPTKNPGGTSGNTDAPASPAPYTVHSDDSDLPPTHNPLASPDHSMPTTPPPPSPLKPLPETSVAAITPVVAVLPPLPISNNSLGAVQVSPRQVKPAATPNVGTPGGLGAVGDDEPVFSLVKGDGSGKGRGTGAGAGIDRGLSAADRQPQLLRFGNGPDSSFTLPLKYQMKPPEKSVKLLISIAPDGSIANVRIEQSCGIPEVDEQARSFALASLHFSPAYKAGKAVAAEFPFESSFKPFD